MVERGGGARGRGGGGEVSGGRGGSGRDFGREVEELWEGEKVGEGGGGGDG